MPGGERRCTLGASEALIVQETELLEWTVNITVEQVLIILAAIGLVVLLMWAPALLEAFVTFHEWLEKKLEENRLKRERTDRRDE